MLNNYAFCRFYMFLNEQIENVCYISSPQRNQIIIDCPKSTLILTTYEYCNKST
ncbi:hypothetical protein SAMN05216261_1383 [Algibacter luteus]|uniref:Uncharacterized protein n=1 Tax=Algibacter luteus TaxID=1178825 RepID=A0A1M6D669_9FLAO|nr:hypothetical protein SAMN05216261_1383 [Algibacter luteus]